MKGARQQPGVAQCQLRFPHFHRSVGTFSRHASMLSMDDQDVTLKNRLSFLANYEQYHGNAHGSAGLGIALVPPER